MGVWGKTTLLSILALHVPTQPLAETASETTIPSAITRTADGRPLKQYRVGTDAYFIYPVPFTKTDTAQYWVEGVHFCEPRLGYKLVLVDSSLVAQRIWPTNTTDSLATVRDEMELGEDIAKHLVNSIPGNLTLTEKQVLHRSAKKLCVTQDSIYKARNPPPQMLYFNHVSQK